MRVLLVMVLLVLVVIAILLGPSAYAFYVSQGPLPGGVTLSGMQPMGDTLEDVARNLHETFQQPIAVYYDDQRIIMQPSEIDFQVDVNAMVAEAVPLGEGLGFWRPFLGEVVEQPVKPIDIPLRYSFSEEKLAQWYGEVAASYDEPARPPNSIAVVPGTPYTSTFMFQAGQPGLELEPQLSLPLLLDALTSPTEREASLVLVEVPPPQPTIEELEKLLARRAEQFPGLVSVFVRPVNGAEEAAVDPDIAFAGMSTMKVPILVELYRSVIDGTPDLETNNLITKTIDLSGNFTANLLLRLIGGGPIGAEWTGVDRVTATMQELGLRNTFMATPYDKDTLPKTYTTPANSRTDASTDADKHMQTTAKDIGLLLEWIVQCSQGGGTLLAAYPGQLTPDECRQMLDYVALNKIGMLLETGVPEGTRIIHKHGFVYDSHSDAAVVWSPAGPYVVTLFIHKPGWVDWPLSQSIMADVSKAAWDYFTLVANGGQPPQEEAPAPLPDAQATEIPPPTEESGG